ncbi:hypothetical protein B0J18DRAFT_134854 [Chaetomium sp. MPI-SDFR-AT-0129]|nr:hypothetical protein B0J18DRAFT_134854 [Chaetomium sp. MPI-SDFR-AT-0129]
MADDVTPLASLSLTHVYYNPSDPLSTLSAFLSLLPQALMIVYVTLFWSTREAEVLLMFLGQLACEAVNFILKRLIKEERPKLFTDAAGGAAAGHGYGMPSSHAQFVFFWAVALTLFLVVRHRPVKLGRVVSAAAAVATANAAPGVPGVGVASPAAVSTSATSADTTISKADADPTLINIHRAYLTGGLPALTSSIEAYSHTHWTLPQRFLVSAGAVLVAALVAWSRVYLGYHTVRQVLAGCAAGVVCGVGWFTATYVLRETGLLAWGLETPPARWLRIRDLVVVEDLPQAGWEKWEGKRRAALESRRAEVGGRGKKEQ